MHLELLLYVPVIAGVASGWLVEKVAVLLTSVLTCDWLPRVVSSPDFPDALLLLVERETESANLSTVIASRFDSGETLLDEVMLEQGVGFSPGLDAEFPATPPTLVPQGHAVHTLPHPLLERGGVFRNPEQQAGLSL